jgi:hypothetical protein
MLESVTKAIREKEGYISRMATKYAERLSAKTAPPGVLECFAKAKMNLGLAKEALAQNNHEKVVYYYGRLCTCLGEVLGRLAQK